MSRTRKQPDLRMHTNPETRTGFTLHIRARRQTKSALQLGAIDLLKDEIRTLDGVDERSAPLVHQRIRPATRRVVEAAQGAGATHGMFTPGEIVYRAVHADMTLVSGLVVAQTTMKKMLPIPTAVATSAGEGARRRNVPEMTTTLERVDRIVMAGQVGKRTAKNHL
jgi:hypothetical protein